MFDRQDTLLEHGNGVSKVDCLSSYEDVITSFFSVTALEIILHPD